MNDDRTKQGAGAPQPPQTGATPPEDPHAPPTGTRTMNMVRMGLLIVTAIVAVLSVGIYVTSRAGSSAGAKATTKVAKYHCPMHPSYTSDRPGDCPICGMTLVPIESGAQAADASMQGDVPGLAGVQIDPDRVQRIGVRTATAGKQTLGSTFDVVAFVTPDESRLKRVQLRVAGWVEHLNVNRTGEQVRSGQPLLSIYSPELFQSEREFLIELEGAGTGGSGGAGMQDDPAPPGEGTLASARQRLSLLGVPAEEIQRLEREKTAETRLTLHSPVTGTVLERGVTEGQYVGPSTTLLTLADLSRVWLMLDLYEMDLSRVRVGDMATFTADGLPGQTFKGRVEFIYPTISPETRTVKARVVLDNPGGELRPGIYGRVHLTHRGPAVLAVPTEAVIHTGEHDYVFIMHADGHFEPRLVKVGGSDDQRTEIRSGLSAGDTVVTSAAFLIDSESRLRASITGAGNAAGGHEH